LAHTTGADPQAIRLGFLLHHRLADLAALRGDIPAALEHERACSTFAERGSARMKLFAMVAVAQMSLVAGGVDESVRIVKAVADEVVRNGDASIVNELANTHMQIDLERGDFASVRTTCETRLAAVRAQGDRWRLTAMLLIAAIVTTALGEPEKAVEAAEQFLAAYADVHHDEAYTWHAMARLARMLDERGLPEIAARVRGTLERRKDEVAIAFAAAESEQLRQLR
jgi:hypothetical protein